MRDHFVAVGGPLAGVVRLEVDLKGPSGQHVDGILASAGSPLGADLNSVFVQVNGRTS